MEMGKGNVHMGVGVGGMWKGTVHMGVGEMGKGNLCMGVGVGGMGKGNVRMGVGEMGKGNLCMCVGVGGRGEGNLCMGVGVGRMGEGNLHMGVGEIGKGNLHMGVGEMGKGNQCMGVDVWGRCEWGISAWVWVWGGWGRGRGISAWVCLCVAFEPLEYPREDSHAYSVTTKEELLDWLKNGDQTYRDLLVPVCVLASSPSSAFRYKSYADFFLIILDFCIAVASVWPQPSANRSLIQVGLIRPGRNVTLWGRWERGICAWVWVWGDGDGESALMILCIGYFWCSTIIWRTTIEGGSSASHHVLESPQLYLPSL
ncbi:hypothetical protein EDB85DRAFT_1898644 [Lactarius pseudohatsudake]|nr:hypothetical protein EDB85DRAFT_1898644 [Lactarius pseudohatsudake]